MFLQIPIKCLRLPNKRKRPTNWIWIHYCK